MEAAEIQIKNHGRGRGHHGRMDGGCSKLIVKVFGGVGLESSRKNEGDRGALDTLVYHFRFVPVLGVRVTESYRNQDIVIHKRVRQIIMYQRRNFDASVVVNMFPC